MTGTFALGTPQLQTSPLSWGASAEDVQAAVRSSLGAIGTGVTVISQGDAIQGFNYSITFGGSVTVCCESLLPNEKGEYVCSRHIA